MIIYFDCFSGMSGDMALGALLDLGLDIEALRTELAKLPIDGWELQAEPGMRSFIAGTRALVHAPEQPTHRHLADVRTILEQSTLSETSKNTSLRIFTLLAEAEGRIHGISAEQVHFHEVGALDAIIDIVGVVCGLELLGIEQVYASALPLGSGWVQAAHGRIPVPAPATLALLATAQAPLLPDASPGELVTPTAAAILAALATFERPAMQLMRVGYGLGKRNPTDRPNALRVWLGMPVVGAGLRPAPTLPAPTLPALDSKALVLLETNIDDQSGQQLAYVCEQLMAQGALDAWMTPIIMKKGRPAILLAALIAAEHEEELIRLIMRETTTLGVRRRVIERYAAERSSETVETAYGQLRMKRKYWQGQDLGAMPEYEDCASIAREQGIPLRHVIEAEDRRPKTEDTRPKT